jgi:hypothetical protein
MLADWRSGSSRRGSRRRKPRGAVLRLAQPSVSARMAGLERSIGLDLFARSTRGVSLTAAGRALEPYARRCVALAGEGRLSARASAGSQRLVMASPPSLGFTLGYRARTCGRAWSHRRAAGRRCLPPASQRPPSPREDRTPAQVVPGRGHGLPRWLRGPGALQRGPDPDPYRHPDRGCTPRLIRPAKN